MENTAKPRVLVVEDDIDIRESVVDYLEMLGYEIKGVCDGQKALDSLRESPILPDIILLDLMMPVMDGFAFREAQLMDANIANIPVLIMSADGNVQEKKNKIGAKGYLKKPVDLDDLVNEIHRCSKEKI